MDLDRADWDIDFEDDVEAEELADDQVGQAEETGPRQR